MPVLLSVNQIINMKIIILIGFMGAGKSSIAVALSRKGYIPLDLDRDIETRSGMTIQDIFTRQGESAFRDLEEAALKCLDPLVDTVIATGGGVVGRASNWNTMRQLGCIVYLRTQWETLQGRLNGSEDRPLINSAKRWEEVRALWESRLPLYEQADVIVDTDGRDPDAIAAEIILRTAEFKQCR